MRRRTYSVAALVVCCLAATAHAQWSVAPDRQDGVYRVGDAVRWRVRWTGDASAAPASVHYTVKKGFFTKLAEADATVADGIASVETKLASPGGVSLEVTSGGRRTIAGAVAAPDRIKPAVPAPPDFDAFWDAKLSQLAQVPARPLLAPRDSGKAGVDYWHVTMNGMNGMPVRGQLARPAGHDKRPALLIVQWAGVYPLEKHWAVDRAAEGWLVLNISAHIAPVNQAPEFFKRLASGPLKEYWAQGNDDRETSYFLRMYLSCHRAADYLTTRDDWDGKTLAVLGSSQGGQQALVTAALHPNVTAAVAGVPAGCDMRGPDVGRRGGWPQWYDWTQGKDPERVRRASEYFDVVNFAPRIKCPVLVGIGLADEVCPPDGIFAAVNLIRGPKEVVVMPAAGHQNENGSHDAYEKRCWGVWLPALREGKPAPVSGTDRAE